DRGGRLIAHLATPGSAVDSLTAEWVGPDSSRTEVGRAQARFEPSAGDPVDDAVADFAADLAPGAYSVGLAVTDTQGRRGTSRMPVVIDRPPTAPALSDRGIRCGVPLPGDENAPVRLEPNPARRVDG